MKPHCVLYILYRDIGYGTLCSTALSIGVVSARGSRTKKQMKSTFFVDIIPWISEQIYNQSNSGRASLFEHDH
jgi:hypothetical protein